MRRRARVLGLCLLALGGWACGGTVLDLQAGAPRPGAIPVTPHAPEAPASSAEALPASASNATSGEPASNAASGEPARSAPKPLAVAGGTEPVIAAPPVALSPEAARRRDVGLAAMAAGRFLEAKDAFAEVLDRYPGDIATKALFDAAAAALERSHQEAARTLSSRAPVVLARPPFDSALVKPATAARAGAAPRLVKVSEATNSITDDDAWFIRNGLSLPTLAVRKPAPGRSSALPPDVPTSYGNEPLVAAIAHPDHTILLYGAGYGGGRHLVVLDAERRVSALLDFVQYWSAPSVVPGDESFVDQGVHWAEVQGGVLYVSNGHRTYAKSSGGKNAYITAIDLKSGELLWRSAPLVSNSANFLIRDGIILTGYGFTAEPDFLYVLDQSTGKTLSRVHVNSGPDYLIEKQGKLFVRTYDTDYVFEVR